MPPRCQAKNRRPRIFKALAAFVGMSAQVHLQDLRKGILLPCRAEEIPVRTAHCLITSFGFTRGLMLADQADRAPSGFNTCGVLEKQSMRAMQSASQKTAWSDKGYWPLLWAPVYLLDAGERFPIHLPWRIEKTNSQPMLGE